MYRAFTIVNHIPISRPVPSTAPQKSRRHAASVRRPFAALLIAAASSPGGMAPARAQSGAPPPLSLEGAIRTALRSHPSLDRTQEQIGVARARSTEAGSGMRPTITVQGVASDGPLGAPAFGPLNNPALNGVPPLGIQGLAGDPIKKQLGASLNVQQPLLDWGRTSHLVASRKALAAAAEQDAGAQQALVVLSVQQAYLGVLRQQALENLQQENVRQRDATLRQAKAFVEGELKSGVELELARADASDARVGLLAAKNDTQIAFATLNNAMGETSLATYRLDPIADPPESAPAVATNGQAASAEPASIPSLGEEASEAAPSGTLDTALAQALSQRPEMVSLSRQVDAADQAIRSVRSERMPRLDAIASTGAINPSRDIPTNKNYGAAVALTIPLYVGGMVEGRTDEENKKRAALLAQQRETAETVRLQVTRAWLTLQTREAQRQVAREQAAAAQSSLRLASERYRLQLNTVVELTEAEAAAVRARTQLINATYDREQARAELDWATGRTYRRYAATPTQPPANTTPQEGKANP